MKILLLSAYDAASHQRWRQELEQQFSDYEWTQLSLPPRYFNWRIRGNSLTWAFNQRDILEQSYDLLIATSMVDLSSLRGFIPSLAHIPTLVYFHENQFAYPQSNHQTTSVEPQIISLYSALCADQLVFNSHFNRDTFIAGVSHLLQRLPDHVPDKLPQQLFSNSKVVPVPLADKFFTFGAKKSSTINVVWNHRWEYDKGPGRLFSMLTRLFQQESLANCSITFHIVGQQFRQTPAVFDEIKQLLIDNKALGYWGYVESAEEYLQLLRDSHVVISTALHDFQGLSVLEAVAAGCIPLVPDRQAYPEWFNLDYRYASYLDNEEREAEALTISLEKLLLALSKGHRSPPPDISYLAWSQSQKKYAELFEQLSHTFA